MRDPVFVLCSVRSGSTLLRAILNSHSRIHAPHELHFNDLQVKIDTPYGKTALDSLGLSTRDLENVLWDRLLYGLLVESGKEIIVDKTPQNAAQWGRIKAAWPHARYIHLHRHPAAILRSRLEARPSEDMSRHLMLLARQGKLLDAARAALPGPTVRYEDLVADPAEVTRGMCAYLGMPWEPAMIEYKVPETREQRSGLGDSVGLINSGVIHAAREAPTEIPDEIRPMVESWGYA